MKPSGLLEQEKPNKRETDAFHFGHVCSLFSPVRGTGTVTAVRCSIRALQRLLPKPKQPFYPSCGQDHRGSPCQSYRVLKTNTASQKWKSTEKMYDEEVPLFQKQTSKTKSQVTEMLGSFLQGDRPFEYPAPFASLAFPELFSEKQLVALSLMLPNGGEADPPRPCPLAVPPGSVCRPELWQERPNTFQTLEQFDLSLCCSCINLRCCSLFRQR